MELNTCAIDLDALFTNIRRVNEQWLSGSMSNPEARLTESWETLLRQLPVDTKRLLEQTGQCYQTQFELWMRIFGGNRNA